MDTREIKKEIKYINELINRIRREDFKLSTKTKLIKEQLSRRKRLIEKLKE